MATNVRLLKTTLRRMKISLVPAVLERAHCSPLPSRKAKGASSTDAPSPKYDYTISLIELCWHIYLHLTCLFLFRVKVSVAFSGSKTSQLRKLESLSTMPRLRIEAQIMKTLQKETNRQEAVPKPCSATVDKMQ